MGFIFTASVHSVSLLVSSAGSWSDRFSSPCRGLILILCYLEGLSPGVRAVSGGEAATRSSRASSLATAEAAKGGTGRETALSCP
ncbi:hypothetical protein C8Q70DRAFT_991543 [Cubamyces menziesii]|nr:hypothetical protein C8Q70DRAFT_991543 [Cubamyces menziesii]